MLTPKSIDIVVYHAPCQDGTAAAFVADVYTKQNGLAPCKFIGIPATPPPIDFEIEGKNILYLDCAPTNEQVAELRLLAAGFLVLDHHKTNKDRLVGVEEAVFADEKSGVGMAWEYFFPGKEMPLFLAHIQDRDLWTWRLPQTRAFCEGFYSYCLGMADEGCAFGPFDKLFEDEYKGREFYNFLLNYGEINMEITKKKIAGIAAAAVKKLYKYNGHVVCAVNCSHDVASDLGSHILENYPVDFVVAWRYNHPTEEYFASLRSKGQMDVAAICKKFGGGGHKNAAGCSLKEHPSTVFGDEITSE